MRISKEEKEARRILKIAIQRTNTLTEKIGFRSEASSIQSAYLHEIGVHIEGEKLKYTGINQIAKTLTQSQLSDLKSFSTYLKEFEKMRKKLEESGEIPKTDYVNLTDEQKEYIHEKLRETADIKDWISANLGSIYEYEKQHGDFISNRNGKQLTYDDLYFLKGEVEKMLAPKEEFSTYENIKE